MFIAVRIRIPRAISITVRAFCVENVEQSRKFEDCKCCNEMDRTEETGAYVIQLGEFNGALVTATTTYTSKRSLQIHETLLNSNPTAPCTTSSDICPSSSRVKKSVAGQSARCGWFDD